MDKKEYVVNETLEAMLKASVEDIEHEMADELLDGFYDQEHIFSEKHKNDMKLLFEKDRKLQSSKNTKIYLRRAAAIFIAVIGISIATISSVSALKIRFLNFIAEITEIDTTIRFTDGSAKSNSYSFEDIILEYIPDGFKLEKSESRNGHILLNFANNNEFFSFRTIEIEGSLSIDTEDAVIKEITIKKNDAFLSVKDNVNILVWHDNETAYILTGNINENELIKIAENKK